MTCWWCPEPLDPRDAHTDCDESGELRDVHPHCCRFCRPELREPGDDRPSFDDEVYAAAQRPQSMGGVVLGHGWVSSEQAAR